MVIFEIDFSVFALEMSYFLVSASVAVFGFSSLSITKTVFWFLLSTFLTFLFNLNQPMYLGSHDVVDNGAAF